MRRLTIPACVGLAAATAIGGGVVLTHGSAPERAAATVAASGPDPVTGLRPGEAYAGAGLGLKPTRQGTVTAQAAPAGIRGVDVASFQGPDIDWAKLKIEGVGFAFVKATESTNTTARPTGGYVNPHFANQYGGARGAGIIRGAYHFAMPHESTGAAQADWFINHGGGWTQDGWTLPGVLDIEPNPYSGINKRNACYNLTPAQTVAWVKSFSDRYFQRTGRLPVIYTATAWWTTCTGNSTAFASHPLWLARYGATPGTLPKAWSYYTMWQYAPGTQPPGAAYPTGNESVYKWSHLALQKMAGQARTGFSGVNAGPEPVRYGKPLTVLGQLYYFGGGWRWLGGKPVNVYYRLKGTTKWVYAARVTTDRYGKFRKVFTARKDASWRVSFTADNRYFGTTSGSDYVDVR